MSLQICWYHLLVQGAQTRRLCGFILILFVGEYGWRLLCEQYVTALSLIYQSANEIVPDRVQAGEPGTWELINQVTSNHYERLWTWSFPNKNIFVIIDYGDCALTPHATQAFEQGVLFLKTAYVSWLAILQKP